MPLLTAVENQTVRDIVSRRAPGYTMPGELYSSELVYRAELERIWPRGWLFVGHTCEVREPGDYFTFAVDGDSLIVIRDDAGEINALWNVCRHRGTELCSEPQGRVGRLVCPYHQWTYGRDGSLASCRGMQEDLDKSQLGLMRAHVRVLEGLIFVSLAQDPPDFTAAAAAIGPLARPQGFERAKVAKVVDYNVGANWKIVWENNRECYHCNVNHPQYIKANFDHYNADDANDRIKTRLAQAVATSEAKWAVAGLAVSHRESGMTQFPDAERNCWFAANRTPLVEGYVSETMDGRQAAPLMGDYSDADVGTLRIRTLPNMWNHSSCDHGVSTRLLPAGQHRTAVRVTWLVDQDAVEGRDYRLEDIMPFWQLTSEQDWELCELAQRGVSSSGYVPGPYSTYKEYNVDAFVRWCLYQLQDHEGERLPMATDQERAQQHAEIVVIGGGAVGCAVAYSLARAGKTDVLLVEKEPTVAAVTTPQAAGLVGQFRNTVERTKLAMWSVETFSQLQRDEQANPGWRQVGSLRVALTDERVAEFERMKAVADESGLEADFIDNATARQKWPAMNFDRAKAVVWCPSDGYLQPSDLTMSYVAHARRLGARFQTKTAVEKVLVKNGRVTGVQTDKGRIDCDMVVNAAGAHAYHIAKSVGLELPIVPVRHEYFVTVHAEGLEPTLPVIRIPDSTLYLRAEINSLLCGGWEPEAMSTPPRTYALAESPPPIAPDWDWLGWFAEQLAPEYPQVQELGVRSVFKGWPTFTPDGRFIVGPSSKVKGFVMAGGCNAHGVSGSAGIGRHVVESILEPDPSPYVKSLSPDRFNGQTVDWEAARRQAQHVYETYYHVGH